jgi:protein TonB
MANAEIFFEHERWGRNLSWSLGLHAGITTAIVLYAIVAHNTGSTWGDSGGGEAIGVSLVNTVPLPANPVKTQSVLATESKGLSQSQPKPKEEDQDAIPIADKHAKTKPQPQVSETIRKPLQQQQPQQENVVPYGEGGPSTQLYGSFNAGPVNAGFNFTGGGGDFGTRFAWYVRVISQKVHENWLAYEVNPNISEANRFYLSFDISRDGRPTNIHVEQSSGIPSLDLSAVRALQRIDTFGPLPSDYSGNKVSVEFSFDYKK